MVSIKQQIIWDIGSDIINTYAGKQDPDSWARRHFTLWCEGSYENNMEWEKTRLFLEDNLNNPRELRRFVIRQFTEFVAYEYNISYGHAQKCIVTAAQREDELDKYTRVLIDDLIDYFVDERTCGIHIK
tara:strand:- start:7319 stop:7705 length:387 start_codon:yes stop_codon:yes gene_type:complete